MEAALETSLRLIDEEGLETFSMRRLADELGVGVMTLYGYVSSKDELLDRVVGLALDDLGGDVPPGVPADDTLSAAIHDLLSRLRQHPNIVALILSRKQPFHDLDRFRDRLLGILMQAGFSAKDAVLAMNALACYTLGYALVEQMRPGDGSVETEARRLRQLPPQSFPALSKVADAYARHASAHSFDAGLTALIAGLRNAGSTRRL